MGRISPSYRGAQPVDDQVRGRDAPAVDADAEGLIHRLASTHRALPRDVITRQVGEVRTVLGWLGDDPEVNATLEKAVDHNLSQIETALASGAGLSHAARDGHEPGREGPQRSR